MESLVQPFGINQGATFIRVIQVFAAGSVANITGYTADIAFFEYPDDSVPVLEVTTSNSISLSNPTQGQLTLELTTEQTAAMQVMQDGWVRIRLTAPDMTTVYEIATTPFSVAPFGLDDCGGSGLTSIISFAGPQGVAGAGSGSGTALAGATISVEQAVVIVGGRMYPADPTNLAHAGRVVGVAAQSGNSGSPLNYVSAGLVPGGSFTQDAFYFVGIGGNLSTSQNAPGAAWSQCIGYAKDTGTLVVQMGGPFALNS